MSRSVAAVRGWERRRENDERAVVNMAPEHHALWRKVRGASSGATPHARAEWLAEYAEEHPAEVAQALDEQADAILAERVKARELADRAESAAPALPTAPAAPPSPKPRKRTRRHAPDLARTVATLARRVAQLERELAAVRDARTARPKRRRVWARWLNPTAYVEAP